tara:strand:+ start:8438 stop:8557 length:120 start_codon:yes stop_codon:yes gene_type:complete
MRNKLFMLWIDARVNAKKCWVKAKAKWNAGIKWGKKRIK